MKGWRWLTAIAGITVVTTTMGWSQLTIAQDNNGCYMVMPSGSTVNLDRLCGGSASPSGTNRASSPAVAKDIYTARIKYRLSGTPVIDVTFNGSRTFEMIVDTGASGTLITRSMATALNVTPFNKSIATMADGRMVAFDIGRVNSIAIDGAEMRNVPVAIADRTNIGLLGHDFFGNYDVKIKQDVVEFYRR
ncbi:retropepsin-like aspartic protease family protein [Pantanalinema sp. GBBB05]|uniref:retropepsin-like aspartic protease family protein n=1 Tax=Pantanalinema sp. GBBB05 TaxID=2604139 RepID=UPI001DCD839E|nr:aspartyl protease [Pantanalinema sp. GBBB05]